MTKKLLALFLGCLAITACLAIFVLISGNFNERELNILWTTAILTFYSLIGMAATRHLDKLKTRWLGILVLLFCCFAAIFAIVTTWFDHRWRLTFDLLYTRYTHFVYALALAHACLILLVKPRNLLVVVLMALAIGVVLLNTLLLTASNGWNSSRLTMIGILSVVAVFTTFAAPISNRFFDPLDDRD